MTDTNSGAARAMSIRPNMITVMDTHNGGNIKVIDAGWDGVIDYIEQPRERTKFKGGMPVMLPFIYKGNVRDKNNCIACTIVMFDVDNSPYGKGINNAPELTMDEASGLINYQAFLYSSFSHQMEKPKERPADRFRLMVPIHTVIPASKWKDKEFGWSLLTEIGIPSEYHGCFDAVCVGDRARCYYLPDKCARMEHIDGTILNPMALPEKNVIPLNTGFTKKRKGLNKATVNNKYDSNFALLDVVEFFKEIGLYLRPAGCKKDTTKHHVTCPWAHEHSETNPKDTVIWESKDGKWPQFFCSHEHCQGRGITHVIDIQPDIAQACLTEEYNPNDDPEWLEHVSNLPRTELKPLHLVEKTQQAVLKRYAFCVGSSTNEVLDLESGAIMPERNFRGKTRGMIWDYSGDKPQPWDLLCDARRLNIARNDVVFSPTKKTAWPQYNTFRGIAMSEVAASDDDIRLSLKYLKMLLFCLCAGNLDYCDYQSKWLAYPLHYPGAKMYSAVVVSTKAMGVGKSMFFDEAMGRVYGEEHTAKLKTGAISAPFNEWMSRKLYVFCEEIARSRWDAAQEKALVKDLITGESNVINKKFCAPWVEKNHMNFSFLSNETMPVDIEDGDRRFFVIGGHGVEAARLEEEEYNAMADFWKEKPQALYHALRTIKVDQGFWRQKPPMTDRKNHMIAVGMLPSKSFITQWLNGAFEIPLDLYFKMEDLYQKLFVPWCLCEGEKAPSRRWFQADLREAGFENGTQRLDGKIERCWWHSDQVNSTMETAYFYRMTADFRKSVTTA